MIRDAVRAGLLPEQILEARLSEVVETATSTYLSALDNDEQATARLYVQKAAQAADETWEPTVSELQGRGVVNPTIAALTTSMRQIGVGTPGGAEALAIFHQLLYDEWMTGSLGKPLAQNQVDEKIALG